MSWARRTRSSSVRLLRCSRTARTPTGCSRGCRSPGCRSLGCRSPGCRSSGGSRRLVHLTALRWTVRARPGRRADRARNEEEPLPTVREVEDKFTVGAGFAVPDLAHLDGIATVDEPEFVELDAVYYD